MKGSDKSYQQVLFSMVTPLFATVILICVTAVFCHADSDSQQRKKSLVIGVGRDFYDGPDSRAYLHGSTNTWEALTYLGEGLKAAPWLAVSWNSDAGGRVWRFRLRDGVRFHDGTELSATSAKAAIERIASSPQYDPAGVYRHLNRVEASGPLELVFYLNEPSPEFPNMVAYYSSPIIHPKEFHPDGRLSGLTATGPYRISEIKQGEQIVIEAFDNYWGPKPAYKRVVFRTLPDAQIRAMALMAGEIDAVADVGAILPQQASEIRTIADIKLKQVETATTHYLLFNCRKPPFDKAQSRQWFSNVIHREEMIESLVSGAGRVAADPFSPLASQWGFGNIRSMKGVRPEPTPAPLVILLHSGTLQRWPYRDMAQIIQAHLETFGFRSRIIVREPGAYYEDIQKGSFHLAFQPNTLMTGDPDFFYAYYVASEGPRYCGCGSIEMDKLIDRGRHVMDIKKRQKIYHRLSRLFAENLPLLPLYHDLTLYAHAVGVKNFDMDHNFRPLLVEARPAGAP